tara:strand:+ start:192 stop:662 length:471 start_codon:yes stop_codon:yes gene_type:complete
MKDSLFEMLLSLFEKTITKLKETHSLNQNEDNQGQDIGCDKQNDLYSSIDLSSESFEMELFKTADHHSMRIFTHEEQTKLTKASYQFLMRMFVWGVISAENMEQVLNKLSFTDSRFVSLEEIKSMIRDVLVDELDAEQLTFLDLVLYQKEDQYALH